MFISALSTLLSGLGLLWSWIAKEYSGLRFSLWLTILVLVISGLLWWVDNGRKGFSEKDGKKGLEETKKRAETASNRNVESNLINYKEKNIMNTKIYRFNVGTFECIAITNGPSHTKK